MSIGEHQKPTNKKFRENFDNIFCKEKTNKYCDDGEDHQWSSGYFKKHCLRCGIDAVSLL